MSKSKIMVFKMKDLQIPIIMLLVALAVFTYFIISNKNTTETFSPSSHYQDGQYIANISLADANLDLVVSVKDQQISSIQLANFDEAEKVVYQDLDSTISFVNDYVLSTQSLELPASDTLSSSTILLMNAVKVALSDDATAALTTTYQAPMLEEVSESISSDAVLTEQAPDTSSNQNSAEQSPNDVSASTPN